MGLLLADELKFFNIEEKDFRIETATHFYELGKMSIGQATKFAGIDRIAFQTELSKRNINIHFTVSDLHHDLNTLKSLNI